MSVLCGINPGFYKAAVGHQFARPGNQFWPALCSAGLTDRLLAPFEEHQLLDLGYYITNLFACTTASAVELGNEEYVLSARILEKKALLYRSQCVVFVGLGAYRVAFGHPNAVVGQYSERLVEKMKSKWAINTELPKTPIEPRRIRYWLLTNF